MTVAVIDVGSHTVRLLVAQREQGRIRAVREEKAVIGRLNKAAMEHVVYVPTGFYYGYQAWRSNVSGVVKGPLPFFWGVTKA